MAKKKKQKGPTKARNEGTRLNSFADLLKQDELEKVPEKPKQKIRYDFSYPEHPKFYLKNSFLNCYNFIPLPIIDCKRGTVETGSLTGSVHCSLVPRTDIFIPNTSNNSCKSNANMGETVREFFSYSQLPDNYAMNENNAPQDPVIPGSELRGMIRSMYEAFTNSCMSALDFEKELSSRTSLFFMPAVLHYTGGSWQLCKAKVHKVSQKPGSKYSAKVDSSGRRYITDDSGNPIYSFDNISFSSHKAADGTCYVDKIDSSCTQSGYALIGEQFPTKNNESVFVPELSEIICNDHDMLCNAVKRYNCIIRDFYRDDKINSFSKAKGTTRNIKNFYQGCEIAETPPDDTVIPVWYNIENDKAKTQYLYLSPACCGRELFINDFLKFTHTYEPCSSDSLCPACRLFGMTGKDFSLGSRIRFSDAAFTGERPEYSSITTLKELSGPKPTSMEVYTHLKNEKSGGEKNGFWNYDVYIPYRGDIRPALGNIEINGRKMYYHHPNCKGTDYYAYNPTSLISKNRKRLITVRPLKGVPANKFEFDIFFEHITEAELKMLLVVTSLLFNDSDYYYKIGMGKPIGLGSVKISVENVKLRTIELSDSGIAYKYDITDEYAAYYKYDENNKLEAEDTVRSFLGEQKVNQFVFREICKMTYFNYADEEHAPQYPVPKKGTEIFKWFSNNRTKGDNRNFEQVLDNTGVLLKN